MDQLETLRIFVEIVDQGSLSAVARARAIAPSTVTVALQDLEKQVGVRLLRRTTRTLSPTSEGERLLAACRRILSELDDALESVADEGPLTGPIRVTTTNDFGRSRLAPLITSFMEEHPSVSVELVLTDAVVDLVDDGFDLAIRAGPLRDSRLHARLLMRGTRAVCAAPSYWDAHGRPEHPRELADHNCLVLGRAGAPQRAWAFEDGGRPFTQRVDGDRSANDGGVLRGWAIAGVGVVLKSEWDVAEDLADGRLEAVLQDFAAEANNLYAVHPMGRHLSRRVESFLAHLGERLSPAANG